MEPNTALLVITAVVSVALVFQAVASWGIYRAVRGMSGRVESLAAEAERKLGPLSDRAQELLVTARGVGEHLAKIEQQFAATASVIQTRVGALDAFLGEATDSARLQVARVQDLVETTSAVIEGTVAQVQRGILAPLNEISAILRAVRVGFDFFFFRGRKPRGRHAHQDEEMFI